MAEIDNGRDVSEVMSLENEADRVLTEGDVVSIESMLEKVIKVEEYLYPSVKKSKDGTYRGRRTQPKDVRAFLDAVQLEAKLRGFLTGGIKGAMDSGVPEVSEEIKQAAKGFPMEAFLAGWCKTCPHRSKVLENNNVTGKI
jgi:hypothetical protein